MKIGIVGVGAVGVSALMSIVAREAADEIVLLDKDIGRVLGIVADMQYCAYARRPAGIIAGDYSDLRGAELVIVAAGINEKAGGATDRDDPVGRLRLLGNNAAVVHEIAPKIVEAAPEAIVVIVSNPPEPLAELARRVTGSQMIVSAGTMIDTLRFRFHIAEQLGRRPEDISASVVAEHGNARVFLWSSASIGPTLVTQMVAAADLDQLRWTVEVKVRDANIAIIKKIGASRYGIGTCCGRLAQALAHYEDSLFMLGSHIPEFDMTLAFPTLVRRRQPARALIPQMTVAERSAVEACATKLHDAARQLPIWSGDALITPVGCAEARLTMSPV